MTQTCMIQSTNSATKIIATVYGGYYSTHMASGTRILTKELLAQEILRPYAR